MFEQISSRLQGIFKKLRGQAKLTEVHVDEALKEIRLTLLAADVQFAVARDFVVRIREKAVGKEVLESLTAPQQVIKITRDELVRLLGSETRLLSLKNQCPAVILMVGLQGSGKTTSSVKLAKLLLKEGKRPALVSVDVKRPAALEQLKILAQQVEVTAFDPDSMQPIVRAQKALGLSKDKGFDVLIVDTAGRVHVNDELMEELSILQSVTKASEVLLVADAMTGQDAVNSAKNFSRAVNLTGHILTKLDGDARGGAALSIATVTGVPIKYVGLGEKLSEFEHFHPSRMASRILGMGDVLSLIERAEASIEQKEAIELERKVQQGELTLEDFRLQLRQIKRMGSLSEIVGLLPGASNLNAEADEIDFQRFEAILDSMTRYEREHPKVIDGSRRRRIALGSGTKVSDTNRLLRRFMEARKMVRKLSNFNNVSPKKMMNAFKNLGR